MVGRTARQINTWLAVATAGTVITGLVSWAVGTEWSRLWTIGHAIFGVMLVVLTPAKIRGSVSTGLRRRKTSRWASILLGVLLIAAVVLGFAHSTGVWTGVGEWSPLWTHQLLAFAALPFLVWHMVARESRPRRTDLDRRLLLRGGAAAAGSAMVVGAVEAGLSVFDARGADRRFTGSFEVGSGDPSALPAVYWINDRPPDISPDSWPLRINQEPLNVVDLKAKATPLEAIIDCTGGWWSRQSWDVVPLNTLLTSDEAARSFEVLSATGYRVRFPIRDLDNVYLAVGYAGEELRSKHGAPVRLVAPGRRGPWWVKWVTEIELSDRRWWLQPPFPTT